MENECCSVLSFSVSISKRIEFRKRFNPSQNANSRLTGTQWALDEWDFEKQKIVVRTVSNSLNFIWHLHLLKKSEIRILYNANKGERERDNSSNNIKILANWSRIM